MRAWLRLGIVVVVASTALVLAQVPSALLFGGLLGALVYALLAPGRLAPRPLDAPRWVSLTGQGVVGTIVGASVDWGDVHVARLVVARGRGGVGPRRSS
ncbi:MAG: hypothetical protein PGN15_04770 [Aeromicrobium erythreum]